MKTKIETVRTPSFDMRYFRFGEGDPIVLIPGLSVTSVMDAADFVVARYKRFADSHCVYLLDRRSEIFEGYTLYDMARDTAEALDALGLSSAGIVGNSQGGMIAQLIAIQRPDLVGKLVLTATAARMTPAADSVIGRWIDLAKAGDAVELMVSSAEDLYSTDYFERNQRAFRELGKHVTQDDLARFIILGTSAVGFDAYDDLDKICCPVLVQGGSEDRVLGIDASYEIAGKLGCPIRVYEGFGHCFYDESPDYVGNTLAFLE